VFGSTELAVIAPGVHQRYPRLAACIWDLFRSLARSVAEGDRFSSPDLLNGNAEPMIAA
jgi:hypothetical protein